MGTPKCHKCKKTVIETILHRANPKGETPAIWACGDCHTEPISPERQNILDAISNPVEYDFSDLKEVDESSIEAKLFSILDDIDTGLDMFKPDMGVFENYVVKKIKDAQKLIVSDGYKLFYASNNIGLPSFLNHLYEICPNMKKEGLKEFDGYFTSYDKFLERISHAWEGENPCYNDHPFELITKLINERDELKDQVAGKSRQ